MRGKAVDKVEGSGRGEGRGGWLSGGGEGGRGGGARHDRGRGRRAEHMEGRLHRAHSCKLQEALGHSLVCEKSNFRRDKSPQRRLVETQDHDIKTNPAALGPPGLAGSRGRDLGVRRPPRGVLEPPSAHGVARRQVEPLAAHAGSCSPLTGLSRLQVCGTITPRMPGVPLQNYNSQDAVCTHPVLSPWGEGQGGCGDTSNLPQSSPGGM